MSANTTQVLAVLVGARDRLSRKGGWTKGVMARDALGFNVAPNDPRACSWCLTGALQTAPGCVAAEAVLANILGRTGIINWNDRPWRRQHEVIALLDQAIAQVEAANA